MKKLDLLSLLRRQLSTMRPTEKELMKRKLRGKVAAQCLQPEKYNKTKYLP
jgi:hypothetical protein